MIIPDVNILLYAYNEEVPQHEAAKRWLAGVLDGSELIGLTWQTLWGFARIATNPRVSPNPLSGAEVFALFRQWLSLPGVVIVHPGERHAELLEMLVSKHRAVGPHVSDAALAAIAIERNATMVSTDQDFSRFEGLRWVNPLA